MNERIIPGFEPSPESYAPSIRVMERGHRRVMGLGRHHGRGLHDLGVDPRRPDQPALRQRPRRHAHQRAARPGCRHVGRRRRPSPREEDTAPEVRNKEMSRTMTPNHEDTRARRSRLDRRTAMRLAADEYTRFAEALAGLDDADWSRPTACTKWDVRQVACHTVGMAEMVGGIREGNRQRAIAKDDAGRKGIPFIDALTDAPGPRARRLGARSRRAGDARGGATGGSRPPPYAVLHAPAHDARPAARQRSSRALDDRLHGRHDPDPRPVDAPDRPVRRHGSRARTDPGARRRDRRGRRRGVGGAARPSATPSP